MPREQEHANSPLLWGEGPGVRGLMAPRLFLHPIFGMTSSEETCGCGLDDASAARSPHPRPSPEGEGF